MNNPQQQIQALIFAAEQGIRLEEIVYCLQQAYQVDLEEEQILNILEQIKLQYQSEQLAIELVQINKHYQFLTKKQFHHIVAQLQLQRSRKKLSQAALETLAVIAYRQPVTKTEVEQIRGVNCDYTIQKLLERELISIAGKAATPGRPVLYTTSDQFADYFGINSFNELPQLKDLEQGDNSIGSQQE